MGCCQGAAGGDQGTPAQTSTVDDDGHLVRNGIGGDLLATDDPGTG